MTNTKNLLDELDQHFRRYLEDSPGQNPNLFRMVVTFEALKATFNMRYTEVCKAISERPSK